MRKDWKLSLSIFCIFSQHILRLTVYGGYMSEISIPTSRGVTLAADFVIPVDASNRAVIFAHSFLLDRSKISKQLAAGFLNADLTNRCCTQMDRSLLA